MAGKPLITVQAEDAPNDLKGSSWLLYNGLLLTDVLTEQYETQDIRTPDQSQVTAIHHSIKVTGILNPAINSYFKSGNPEAFPVRQPVSAQNMAGNITLVLEQLLKKDRAKLQFAIGGTIVVSSPSSRLDAPGQTLPCDANQGPKPMYCQVTQIVGTSSFYVRFGIETWIDPCVYVDSNTMRVIKAHRYAMMHDVDGDTWLTTRAVQGQLQFRPEALQLLQKSPDQVVRDWAHPVPYGFKRSKVMVQALPDGMSLAYSFVDSEQTLPLGTLSPATKFTAEFSLSSSIAGDKEAKTQAAIHCQAIGPKNQFRFNLLAMALRVANRKLQKPGHLLTSDIVVTYSLDNTYVDLTMKGLWQPVGIGPEGLQIRFTGLTQTEDLGDLDAALLPFRAVGEAAQGSNSENAQSPQMSENDTVGTYLGNCIGSDLVNGCFNMIRPANVITANKVASHLKISLGEKEGQTVQDGKIENDSGGADFSFSVVPQFSISVAATGLSAESVNGVGLYEEWKMDVSYRTNHQRAVLPVGMSQAASPGDVLTFVPPQVATLGFPYTLKCVDWSVAWIGPNPAGITLPSPDTGDANDVLLCEDVTPAVPGICNSSHKSWRVSGTYWYLCKGLHTTSFTEKSHFSYTDQGIAVGKSIADPNLRAANTINLTRFVAGYSPSFVG